MEECERVIELSLGVRRTHDGQVYRAQLGVVMVRRNGRRVRAAEDRDSADEKREKPQVARKKSHVPSSAVR
jgi:hypothetical protein